MTEHTIMKYLLQIYECLTSDTNILCSQVLVMGSWNNK